MQKQPQRIIVIGTTGAGKSHLAARISARTGYPHTDLDDLFWLPGWTPQPTDVFRASSIAAASTETFVISGNYFSTVAPDIWPKADTLVWVDYSFWRVLGQLLRRSWRRSWSRIPICNGNVESWWKLLSKDSIIWWFFKTFHRNRRRYDEIFAQPAAYPNLHYVRLSSPQAVDKWLLDIVIK